jgi:hypothetical protein
VRAWIDYSAPPLHVLKAELIQNELTKANATGKFVEHVFFELRKRYLEGANDIAFPLYFPWQEGGGNP